MSNTEQVATVGPQMVTGIRYRNEVAAATAHNHAYRAPRRQMVFGRWPNQVSHLFPDFEDEADRRSYHPEGLQPT